MRLVGDGRSVAVLSPDASVQWWCAPEFDDRPLCWRLLDRGGGTARFPGLEYVDANDVPASASATTFLRDAVGTVEVRDGLLRRGDGVLLVRLLRRRADRSGTGSGAVEHELRLGGFDAPYAAWSIDGDAARAQLPGRERPVSVRIVGGRTHVDDGVARSRLEVTDQAWVSLVVAVDAEPEGDPAALAHELSAQADAERSRLRDSAPPRTHPQRALDALAVIRACTSTSTGAVVASPTTSLPEGAGHDRQFDYRFTWLRDASLSTAVAALVGQPADARRYLEFVHSAWRDRDVLTTPVRDIPDEREVDGVAGWAGSLPVRVGNGAAGQRQYDSLGLFAEAVSVYVQAGGKLDPQTWQLLTRLADQIAEDDPDQVKDSNGIWEMGSAAPLVDGDIGRWLLLDRALWVARGWRPWTRRRRWKRARAAIRSRVVAAIDDDGLLPQAYGQDPPVPDASALMAVAFGLLEHDDPRAVGSSTRCSRGSAPARTSTDTRRGMTTAASPVRGRSCRCPSSW